MKCPWEQDNFNYWQIPDRIKPKHLRSTLVGWWNFFVSRMTLNYLNNYFHFTAIYKVLNTHSPSVWRSPSSCANNSPLSQLSRLLITCSLSLLRLHGFHLEQPASQELLNAPTEDQTQRQLLFGQAPHAVIPDSFPCLTKVKKQSRNCDLLPLPLGS